MRIFNKQNRNGGFTLVELIVVLIVLALLAAILVPTLTGYINKARDERNMQAAETVRVAAQSIVADQLAHSGDMGGTIDSDEAGDAVFELAGVNTGNGPEVSYFSFSYGGASSNYAIDEGQVTIGEGSYVYQDGYWSVDQGVSTDGDDLLTPEGFDDIIDAITSSVSAGPDGSYDYNVINSNDPKYSGQVSSYLSSLGINLGDVDATSWTLRTGKKNARLQNPGFFWTSVDINDVWESASKSGAYRTSGDTSTCNAKVPVLGYRNGKYGVFAYSPKYLGGSNDQYVSIDQNPSWTNDTEDKITFAYNTYDEAKAVYDKALKEFQETGTVKKSL